MLLVSCTNNSSIFCSEVEKMTALLFRTVLIYILLIFAMRMMGKRQIGELEISDLVTTLLISEIASLPITDTTIPLTHALIPITLLVCFEVLSSALLANYPKIKNLITARPATLIRDGTLCKKAMKDARISADELISELRQNGISDPKEVRYAILEQNGKITVIPHAQFAPPSAKQLNLQTEDSGLFHIIIDKGVINKHNLKDLQLSKQGLTEHLKESGLSPKDIYLMMINDSGEERIIQKSEVQAKL